MSGEIIVGIVVGIGSHMLVNVIPHEWFEYINHKILFNIYCLRNKRKYRSLILRRSKKKVVEHIHKRDHSDIIREQLIKGIVKKPDDK